MRRVTRTIAAAGAAIACCITMTACSSPFDLPISGSVQTLAPVEQQTQRVYTNPQGPADDAQPETIVKGFYDAMPAGVQSDGYRVAREFLTGSASAGWNGDSAALVYSGTPDFRRRANTISAPQGAESSLIVEVELQVVGSLDSHGVYTPSNSTQTRRLPYTLMKKSGQWRISSLESGVVISTADFEQVFRQVSVYQVSTSGKQLIPDIRWLSWRNWRTQAVGEVLSDAPSWLEGVLRGAGLSTIKLAVDSVPVKNNVVEIHLNSGINALNEEERGLLVHRIRLTMGDGNAEYALRITGDGVDYSDADANVKLTTEQPTAGVYTLTGGHIVSLASSSPLRVGEAPGYDDARGFVFSSPDRVCCSDGGVGCASAAALVSVAACGPSNAGGSSDSGKKTVGFVAVGPEGGFRTANEKDIQQAFEDAGFDLTYSPTQNNDQQKQIQAFNKFVNDEVDAIILSSTEDSGWDDPEEAARQRWVVPKPYPFRAKDLRCPRRPSLLTSDRPTSGAASRLPSS